MAGETDREAAGRTGGAAEGGGRGVSSGAGRDRGVRAGRGADTASALIDAGRELFASDGYDGTSVRALAERAGVNLGAVAYHFGSKRALYHAVLKSTLQPFAERVAGAAEGGGTPMERIDAVVRAYFGFLRDHPEMPKFMLRELVSGGPPPPVASTMRRVAGAVVGVVRDGQADGSVRPGDPVLMALSLISQPVFVALARPAVKAVTGMDAMDAGTYERLVEHAAAFVRAGLTGKAE